MRRPVVAGNWKMNLTRGAAVDLVRSLAASLGPSDSSASVEIVVCPPYVYLEAVGQAVQGTSLRLGAQNVSDQPSGAFTGEISTAMLIDLGCQYVIVGHSERRTLMGETDEIVNRKVLAALAAGLTPIVCVGELLEERQRGQTSAVIRKQFEGSLAGISGEQMARIVIAYEPVWAIGTGQVATPAQAEEVHLDLRSLLRSRYNAAVADAVRIQYGGSVKADNAAELMGQADIDGALVGGASLKVGDFLAIVAAAGGH